LQKGRERLDPALQIQIVSQAAESVVVRVMAELRSAPRAAPKTVRSEQRRAA
jgi:hypothetical protein